MTIFNVASNMKKISFSFVLTIIVTGGTSIDQFALKSGQS